MIPRFLNSFAIKLVAILTMLIDHVGLIFFADESWMRVIGRIAMPLFAFLLVEGFIYTRNLPNYIKRLFIFGIISQLPYMLMNFVAGTDPWRLNIMFTLCLGLVTLSLVNQSKNWLIKSLVILGALLLAEIGDFSYGAYGILLVLSCYLIRKHLLIGSLVFTLATIAASVRSWASIMQIYALGALPIILFYDHKLGPKISRWWFYWFYPAHMFVLAGLYWLITKL